MTKLKEVLWDLCPRDWQALIIALCCVAIGVWNMQQPTWYNQVTAALVLIAAGFTLFGSIFGPKFREMRQQFAEMEQRWKEFQPETAAKRAAVAFRQQITEMQARGELPADAHIIIEGTNNKPPPGRLN